jgi:2'-5' RNA ligase
VSPAGRARDTVTQRLFVAVNPPPDAVEHLGAVVDTLNVSRVTLPGRAETAVTARERWHITLAFLGEVPVRRLSTVERAVGAAVDGVAGTAAGGGETAGAATGALETGGGAAAGELRVRLAGGGTFGAGRSTILWCGIGGDVSGLAALAASVRARLRQAWVPVDGKPYQPHLTLSRPRERVDGEALSADAATLASYEGPLWAITEVLLVASEQGPQPRYTTLARFPLPGMA